MKAYGAALIRELRILMEVTIVRDSLSLSNPGIWNTYLDWELSRMWLVDVSRKERYCNN